MSNLSNIQSSSFSIHHTDMCEATATTNNRLCVAYIENGQDYVVYCDELQQRDGTLVLINPTHDIEGTLSTIN